MKRRIAAPVDAVFGAITDIRNFAKAVPHITKVEFLSEQQIGIGTRFRETRMVKGNTQATELEVTEYVGNKRVRLVSEAGGTIWGTVFTVSLENDTVELTMLMKAKPLDSVSHLAEAQKS